MTTSDTPPPSDDDMDAWLRALAARASSDVSTGTRREADELREAFLQADDERAALAGAAPSPDATWRRLREGALRAGLLEEPAPPAAGFLATLAAWLARPAVRGGLAAAALVLIVGVGLHHRNGVQPFDEGSDVLRGAGELVVLKARDPGATRAALAGALATAGATPHPYERLGASGLDVDWPDAADAAVRAQLAHWRVVPAPAARAVRVEIVATP